MKDIFDLLGRACLAAIFLLAAYRYIVNFDTVHQQIIAEGVTWRPLLLLRTSIFLLILGGILVLFGYRAKLGAALLLFFMVPSTVIFYTDNLSDELEQTMLLKNIAMIGGLLLIFVNGSGKYSIRKLLASTQS